MTLRDASELLYPAVCETIAALGLGSEDAAAVKLAKRYARIIDETNDGKEMASVMWHLGAELHKVLESLGATPAARAAIKTGKPAADAKPNGLQALREARGA